MKYNVGDKYIFKKKNHAYDGCIVEIDQLSDPMEMHCMVHLEGNKDMRIWVEFNNLQPTVTDNIRKGDIILYEGHLFLYCYVLMRGIIQYNAIDEYGTRFRIPIEEAVKISHPNDIKKFFKELRKNRKSVYDKIMDSKNACIVNHLDEIIRLLEYETD